MADQLENLKSWIGARTNLTGEIEGWLMKQDAWARGEAEARASGDESSSQPSKRTSESNESRRGGGSDDDGAPGGRAFWEGVADLAAQLDGVLDGYSAAAAVAEGEGKLPAMKRADVLLLNAIGGCDVIDVVATLFWMVDSFTHLFTHTLAQPSKTPAPFIMV
jgi:hypothetical protein